MCPTAEKYPRLMTALVDNLNAKKDKLHPVELAAYVHRV
jgi:Fic family protein